jgi:hypothetical protein
MLFVVTVILYFVSISPASVQIHFKDIYYEHGLL